MKALGLDLGTNLGWATIANGIVVSGTVSFKGGRFEGGGHRFLRFRHFLQEMFILEKPEVIYYEEVRRHMSTDAAHIYGGLLAILQAECESREIPYLGIPVQTIKKTGTGRGNASKDDMIAAAQSRWPDQNLSSHDQADALWILETGLKQL